MQCTNELITTRLSQIYPKLNVVEIDGNVCIKDKPLFNALLYSQWDLVPESVMKLRAKFPEFKLIVLTTDEESGLICFTAD